MCTFVHLSSCVFVHVCGLLVHVVIVITKSFVCDTCGAILCVPRLQQNSKFARQWSGLCSTRRRSSACTSDHQKAFCCTSKKCLTNKQTNKAAFGPSRLSFLFVIESSQPPTEVVVAISLVFLLTRAPQPFALLGFVLFVIPVLSPTNECTFVF